MNPVIILGAHGQLGKCLQDELKDRDVDVVALSSKDCNITDLDSVKTALSRIDKAIVVNCAAYTSVDKAEDEVEQARRINAQGVNNIALCCKEQDHQLIHISTDYVFDGSASSPYTIEEATSPIGIYGETKLEGEQKALSILPNTIIIRTSWVFSEYGNNFVKTMLRLAQDREELNVVDDQKGKPTYARDLARAIYQIIEQIGSDKGKIGIYHFSNEEETNWYEFAKAIFSLSKELGMIRHDMRVNPIASSDYPTRAERPQYSVLDNSRIYNDFPIQAKSWKMSLAEMLTKLRDQNS